MSKTTRRVFLRAAACGTAAAVLAGKGWPQADGSPFAELVGAAGGRAVGTGSGPVGREADFSLGVASYTFRAFPLERAVGMTKRLGVGKICLKDMHLPLDASPETIAAAAGLVRSAGLELYACGVIYMKSAAEVERAFGYARTAGARTIVGVPNPELLSNVDRLARETGLRVAIHNHGPGDLLYPTPASVLDRVKDLSPLVGLCLDVGHTLRAGVDPARAATEAGPRLLDVHLKDVDQARAAGTTVEVGRGVFDLRAFLAALRRLAYSGVLAFEHEKDEADPFPGLAESVGYVRGMIAALD
jgi:sugar phosphate isomerase/epimerase